ncbi:MAG: PASTA domain-containing protein [Bacteroidia bacterium]
MLSYFKSREFFLTLLGLILAAVLGYFFVFYAFLPLYTQHGEAVLVPDVRKMGFQDADRKLSKADLDFEVSDSVYIPGTPPLSVIKQYPDPLSVVKPGRTIMLTLNKRVPPKVKLPKVLDMTVYNAKATLESRKLTIKSIEKVPDIARNAVLKVLVNGKEIKEGTEVAQGTAVTLIIGEGLKEVFVKVPDLVGKTYSEALSILQTSSLGLGSVEYQVGGGPSGRIFRQYPLSEEDSVKQGWPIDIWISGTPTESEEGNVSEEIE